MEDIFSDSLFSVQTTGFISRICEVTSIPLGGPTNVLIDILFVPGALRAGRLALVVILQPELILLSYPVHVAGGVRHHGGVGASVDVIPQWGIVSANLNSFVTTLGHGERPGKTVLVGFKLIDIPVQLLEKAVRFPLSRHTRAGGTEVHT